MGTIAPSAVKLFWLKDTESENDVKSSGEVRIDYQRVDESAIDATQHTFYIEGIAHDPQREHIDVIPVPINPNSTQPIVKLIVRNPGPQTNLAAGVTDLEETSFSVDKSASRAPPPAQMRGWRACAKSAAASLI